MKNYIRLMALFMLTISALLCVKTTTVSGADFELISRFTTTYNETNTGRAANIKLATSALNKLSIKANEEKSFNEVVGERTTARGYMIARVIESGEYVEGVGGGVCQVSSTLYNALLLAGAKIMEVNPHSLPPGYVPLSRDSMVSYGEFDLKFAGNGISAMFIYTKAENGVITIDIYGKRLPYIIEPTSEVLEVFNPPKEHVFEDTKGEFQDKVIFKGERHTLRNAKCGYKSRLKITKRFKDGSISNEYIARVDFYSPQGALIVTGTL